jgi:hypothetical protein
MIQRFLTATIPQRARPCVEAFVRRILVIPRGWCIVAMVVAVVAARAIWAGSSSSPHLQEISDACGSTALLYGQPQSDHAGAQVALIQQGEKTLTVCLVETASRRKRVIYEVYDREARNLRLWPWSPDDRCFIYSEPNKLSICEAASGSTVKVDVGEDTVRDVAWLSPDEFLYVNSPNTIRSFQRQADGSWKRGFEFQPAYEKGTISSLTAVSSNTIAWLQDDVIWRKNLSAMVANASVEAQPSVPPTNLPPPQRHLVLWLDASRSLLDNGRSVVSLADYSANLNDAVALAAAPTFNAPGSPGALNGKGTIHFTSAAEVSNSPVLKTKWPLPITGASARTVFAVMRRQEGKQMLVDIGTWGSNSTYFGICDQSDYLYLPGVWGADNRFRKLDAGWHVLEAVYDGRVLSGYVNGELKGTQRTTLNTGSRVVDIGLRDASGGTNFLTASEGDFAELLIYDTSLSDLQRQQVRDYLDAKWFARKPASSDASVVWADPGLDGVTDFTYSKEAGQALFSRNQYGATWLYRLNLADGAGRSPIRVLGASSLWSVCWTGQKQCVFATRTSGTRCGLVLANLDDGKQTRLFADGNVNQFSVTPDGGHLFAIGLASNELSQSLWHYDLAKASLSCVVPGVEHPSPYATQIEEMHGSFTVPDRGDQGRKLAYYIYPPANFNPREHKKYPLVIGNTLFLNDDPRDKQRPHGHLWVQTLANSGAFVVVVERPVWTEGLDRWPDNVMAIYRCLLQNPAVDPDRVFLYAASGETEHVCKLLSTNSAPWKGIIFFNPVELPDLKHLRYTQPIPKFYFSLGGLDGRDNKIKNFKEEALFHGVAVDYRIHPNEGHWLVGTTAVHERIDGMLHFVFDDH